MIHVSNGLDTPAKATASVLASGDATGEITPLFTQLEGNLFLAIKTTANLDVEDGDVVEFIFDKKNSLVSFHVNEINQDLIDTGNANLFVMIHSELALKLKSHRLQEIKISHNNEVYTLKVDNFWAPDQYMASL